MSFSQDITDLFSFKRGGHVQKWLYADHDRPDHKSGSQIWHDFLVAAQNYYPIRGETEMMPSLIASIAPDFDTVVDFGIGDEKALRQKTIPLLRSQKGLQRYYAVDISNDNLNAGMAEINRDLPHIKTRGLNGDFYEIQRGIEGRKRLGLFLGTTISNLDMRIGDEFPRAQIVRRLATLGKTLHGGDENSLVVSFDANPDLAHALRSYDHPVFARMMTGLMYDVQSQLKPKGRFNPSMWHYAPIADVKNHVIHQVVSPSMDQDFEINGRRFSVKRGDKFVVMNCFKYPLELFIDMVREAGLKPEGSLVRSEDTPMVMIEATVK